MPRKAVALAAFVCGLLLGALLGENTGRSLGKAEVMQNAKDAGVAIYHHDQWWWDDPLHPGDFIPYGRDEFVSVSAAEFWTHE